MTRTALQTQPPPPPLLQSALPCRFLRPAARYAKRLAGASARPAPARGQAGSLELDGGAASRLDDHLVLLPGALGALHLVLLLELGEGHAQPVLVRVRIAVGVRVR
eukprot:scaffold118835_cov42-Phaeocystis_antarctica.AAC.2